MVLKSIREIYHENTSDCLNDRDRPVDILRGSQRCGPDTNRKNGGVLQSAWKIDA
jgi:hypothetical protein